MCWTARCLGVQYRKPLHRNGPWGPHVILSLLLLPLLGVGGQRSPSLALLPPLPQPLPHLLQDAREKLTELTREVANIVDAHFHFCIEDPMEDWNHAFGYESNLGFVQRCLTETKGDLVSRLCAPEEVKLYFSSLYHQKDENNLILKNNINCNRSSWVQGCEPGWACSLDHNNIQSNSYISTIPLRTTNCQECCEGFFCPQGLTCMLPCPLGSYCPRAKMNTTTGLCDPYKYQIAPNSTQVCGGADMWADFGSTKEVFCPAGYYCPTTILKVSCSSGHYCRLGSTSQEKCIIKNSCKGNTQNENNITLGGFLVAALGVLLLIIYGCSAQLLTIFEWKKERSTESTTELACWCWQLKLQKGLETARQLTRKHVNSVQGHLLLTCKSFHQKHTPDNSSSSIQEKPLIVQVKEQELSDSSMFAPESTSEIYLVNPSVDVDATNDVEIVPDIDKDLTESVGKHRPLHERIYRHAYGGSEEMVLEQENNITTEISMVNERESNKTRPLLMIEFKDLTLTLGKKKLLQSITGKLLPGNVTAVMGPSGAGKTTLINAIAGKVTGYKMAGLIIVNGKPDNIHSYKRIIGFVPQDDIVHGNLTVEDNLWFSANCRLPVGMSYEDKALIVERVIDSLGLQAVRNSLVGTVEKRGISGGQRKRVNVGIEMVMDPSLLILDEPTSGLDSSSSQLLLKALCKEAHQGTNVCAVIHQPSYALYNMFDNLILLAKGGLIVYNGPIKTAEEYFKAIGIHVPDHVNPPDHYIDILEGIEKPNSGFNPKFLPVHWMLYNGYDVPSGMEEDLKTMEKQILPISNSPSMSGSALCCLPHIRDVFTEERDRIKRHFLIRKDFPRRRTPGILIQYKYYLERVTKQRLREARLFAVDFLILGCAGICLGIISKHNDPKFGMPGYIYTIIAVSLLCKVAALRSFSLERLQYWRERESGMSCLAYFLARDTIDHFSTLIKPIVYLSMFYYLNNPRSTMADNYGVLLALVYCVTGIGYTLAICFNHGSAQLCSAIIPVVLTLLSTEPSAPLFLKNLCYAKWALEGFISANAKRYTGVWLITRCGLLFKNHFNIHHYNLCIVLLFVYGICFRIIAFLAMILLRKR